MHRDLKALITEIFGKKSVTAENLSFRRGKTLKPIPENHCEEKQNAAKNRFINLTGPPARSKGLRDDLKRYDASEVAFYLVIKNDSFCIIYAALQKKP